MVTRETVLSELRSLAQQLGRTPGRTVFERESGIRSAEWLGVHWARWGDVVRDAGLAENKLQGRSDEDALLQHLADAATAHGKLPTSAELRMYSRSRPDFPAGNTFWSVLGNKQEMARKLLHWLQKERPKDPLIQVLEVEEAPAAERPLEAAQEGWVYLLRSGNHFKIGRSDQLEKRVKQIATAMPEAVDLEHAIKTDDPVGIEAYWHNRFDAQRKNGEWFELTPADLRAFKRRKFQ